MLDSDADTAKLCMQLAEAYRKLPPLEQRIVQLFSVIYEPVSRTLFMDCFNQTGARDENGRPFVPKSLKPYIDELLVAGLLVQERGQGPKCNQLLVEIATRDAVQAECFETLAKVAEERLPVSSRGNKGPRYFNSEH